MSPLALGAIGLGVITAGLVTVAVVEHYAHKSSSDGAAQGFLPPGKLSAIFNQPGRPPPGNTVGKTPNGPGWHWQAGGQHGPGWYRT